MGLSWTSHAQSEKALVQKGLNLGSPTTCAANGQHTTKKMYSSSLVSLAVSLLSWEAKLAFRYGVVSFASCTVDERPG